MISKGKKASRSVSVSLDEQMSTKEKKLISVVIPVYNVAPFIAEAIESVIHQSYTSLDIVIIDDGSTDGSAQICDLYAQKDRRIQLIHQENKGLSAARNAGLDIIKGDVVAFLDPDDVYCPEFFSTMISKMICSKADIVSCKYELIPLRSKTSDCKIIGPDIAVGKYDRISALQSLYDGSLNNYVWNRLYDSALWKSIRFPEGHNYEDIDTSYRVFDLCKEVQIIDDVLYLYRMREDCISSSDSRENVYDWIRAWSNFDSFATANSPGIFSEKQIQNRSQAEIHQLISFYLKHSRNREEEEKILSDYIRKRIIEFKKNAGIGKCSFRKKVCYWAILFCPRTLTVLYSIYSSIRVKPRKKSMRGNLQV